MNIFHVQFAFSVGLIGVCGYLVHETPGMIFPAIIAGFAAYCSAYYSIKYRELP